MQTKQLSALLSNVVDALSKCESYEEMYHQHTEGTPLPSVECIHSLVEVARALLFPGYYGNSSVNRYNMSYHVGMNVDRIYRLLSEQVLAGLCFLQTEAPMPELQLLQETAERIAADFVASLPQLRRLLQMDVESVYNNDPAAHSYGEVISCYPAIKAITNYRIAHQLLLSGVPLLPRVITEMAHSETGIDIHPGAQIGDHFSIDHGTGVVVGETCIIGSHVQLYQGVTLGAKNFPLDNEGKPQKGIPRHPILEDHVIVYSNATILGRITIGKGSIIGGNIWVTENVPPASRITQNRAKGIGGV